MHCETSPEHTKSQRENMSSPHVSVTLSRWGVHGSEGTVVSPEIFSVCLATGNGVRWFRCQRLNPTPLILHQWDVTFFRLQCTPHFRAAPQRHRRPEVFPPCFYFFYLLTSKFFLAWSVSVDLWFSGSLYTNKGSLYMQVHYWFSLHNTNGPHMKTWPLSSTSSSSRVLLEAAFKCVEHTDKLICKKGSIDMGKTVPDCDIYIYDFKNAIHIIKRKCQGCFISSSIL